MSEVKTKRISAIRRALRKLVYLATGGLLFASGTAIGESLGAPLFEDDFSSYAVADFPEEKWTADDKSTPFVSVAGLSAPVGLQISAEKAHVSVGPRIDPRDEFILEWSAHETRGRTLCVTVRNPDSGSDWGIVMSLGGAECFVLGDGPDPFEDRSVRLQVATPPCSIYAEHRYLLSVHGGGCELFCDGQPVFTLQGDDVKGGVPQIVAVPSTVVLVKDVRVWEWEARVQRWRVSEHRRKAPPYRVCAKRDLKFPMPPRRTRGLAPVEEQRPFERIYPGSPAPAANLRVVRADKILQRHGAGLMLTLTSLQGLVNRTQPRIYIQTAPDDPWPAWLKERGDVEQLTEVADPVELFDEFRDCAEGSVVVDPRVTGTINVATAAASVENLVVVHPDFAAQLPWKTTIDLRDRWISNVEAYRWAYETYWDRLNHHVLGCYYPLQMNAPRDYHVAFKVFPVFVSARAGGKYPEADPEGELEFLEEFLANAPANIPIMGWESQSVGIGELESVRIFSHYGKFLVPSNHSLNLSLHSGTRPGKYKQPPLKAVRPLDPSEVYVTFTMSDGDNLNTWFEFFRKYFADPARGQVPIGWTLGTHTQELIPDLIEWYYSQLTEADHFGSTFGVAYIYPDEYAQAYRNPAALHREYVQLTGECMRPMDMGVLWHMFAPFNDGDPEQLNRVNALVQEYAGAHPWLTAILCDYGKKAYYDYDGANSVMEPGVPVFHAVAPSMTWRATPEKIIRELKEAVGDTRPAFAHVFVFNWRITPTIIKGIVEELGEEFVPVRPDELGKLYLSWHRATSQQEAGEE